MSASERASTARILGIILLRVVIVVALIAITLSIGIAAPSDIGMVIWVLLIPIALFAFPPIERLILRTLRIRSTGIRWIDRD